MKNRHLSIFIALALSFSIFCFCFLNSQSTYSPDLLPQSTELTVELEAEEEQNEVYFPDLAFIEKISTFLVDILRKF